jgi:hypothetical protein
VTRLLRLAVPGAWVAALALAYPLMLFGAALPRPWLFVAGAAVSYAAEWYINRYQLFITRALSKVNIGITLRSFARDALLFVMIARVADLGDTEFVLFGTGVVGLHALRALHSVLTYRIDRRAYPIELFNAPRPKELPPEPPEWLGPEGMRKMLHLDVLPVAGASYGALTHHYVALAVLLSIAVGLAVAADLVLCWYYVRIYAISSDKALGILRDHIAAMKPEVILYFSGSPESAYQLNMWLGVLDSLPRKTLILLRERLMVPLVGNTSAPVACIVNPIDLMNFTLPDVRLAMYVANVGKNIHLLRVPGIQHVFIGHGDSDKQASVNPFSKVYDEVWVAGPAGRERWARANVGVRDEAVREVGRPQLDAITVSNATGGKQVRHVLYAPTWEGWTNDPFHTSLVLLGPDLIRALIAEGPELTVTYKPHPLTGTRDRKTMSAHHEIVQHIRAANRQRPANAQHQIVLDKTPTLFECFNDADLLISDISSVVADFIHSQKPYVVTNAGGVDDAKFRRMNPTASAAYLVGPGCPSLAEVLSSVAAGDPMAERRSALKHHLLGPDEPPAIVRFAHAVDEVVAHGSAAPEPGDLEFGFEPEPDAESATAAR